MFRFIRFLLPALVVLGVSCSCVFSQMVYSHYFRKPFDGSYSVTQNYCNYWSGHGYHDGIDYGLPSGTPVFSTADGVVAATGYTSGWGNYIRIRHYLPNGTLVYSQYAHLNTSPVVSTGTFVSCGQLIGYSGNTGNSTGPHLHFCFLKSNSLGSGYYNSCSAVNVDHMNPNDLLSTYGTVQSGSKFYIDNTFSNYSSSGSWSGISMGSFSGGYLNSGQSLGPNYRRSSTTGTASTSYFVNVYRSGYYQIKARFRQEVGSYYNVRYRVDSYSSVYLSQITNVPVFCLGNLGTYYLSSGSHTLRVYDESTMYLVNHDAFILEFVSSNKTDVDDLVESTEADEVSDLLLATNSLESVSFFPNPFSKELHVSFPPHFMEGRVSIGIYDLQGQRLVSFDLDIDETAVSYELLSERLAYFFPGVYLYDVALPDGSHAKGKLVKVDD